MPYEGVIESPMRKRFSYQRQYIGLGPVADAHGIDQEHAESRIMNKILLLR